MAFRARPLTWMVKPMLLPLAWAEIFALPLVPNTVARASLGMEMVATSPSS